MFSFLGNKRRGYAIFAAIMIVVGLTSGMVLRESWRRKVENHCADEQAILAMSYRATLQMFSMAINSYYFNLLSTDRVLTLLSEAYDGDEEKRDLARGMLYRYLWPYYRRMQSEHIQQLHFHTPDGRSFLRFHDPKHYDDEINSHRSVARLCNQERRPMAGFEVGRIRPGFHFAFPLHNHERRLGVVEMSVTPSSFLKSIRLLDDRHEYAMVISKEAAASNLPPNRMWIFAASVLSDDYLTENVEAGLVDGTTPSSSEIEGLNHFLAKRQDVKKILASGLTATVSEHFRGALHVVSFFPVKDPEGKQVAYLISYGQDPMIDHYGHEYAIIWLGTMMGALLVVMLFARLHARTSALDMERKHLVAVNEALAEGLYFQDKTGKIMGWNAAAEEILGFAKEETIGQDGHTLFHRRPDGSMMPKEECNLHRHFDIGQGYDGHEHFATKDGRLLLIKISCRPILAAGRPMGLACAFHDVTAQRAMEDALRKSEGENRLMARALDQSQASVIIVNRHGIIEYVNHKFTEVSGYPVEEAIGHHPTFFHSGLTPPSIYEELWQAVSLGEVWRGELQSRRKNGETYWETASVSPMRDNYRQITHYVAVKEDISDRLRMEQNLRESEAFQRTLVESLPIGIVIINKESRIIELANPHALKLFGAPAQDVIGQPCHRFLCPDDEYSCPISDLAQEIENGDHDLIRADGTRVPLMKTVRAINDEKKLLECFVDITERKRGENALREANRQLTEAIDRAERLAREAETASRAKSDFLASMSHEIRTPMNAVLGMTHLVLRTELTTQQRDYLDKVDRSARSLLGLLNEILDLSKVEAGKLELEKVPFSLHELLDTVTTVIAARIGGKDIELAVGIDHDVPPWLAGDPLRLRQILINLAGNAAKFTEEGEIVVRARLANQERDKIAIEFIIHDTGIGMDDKQKKAIFQPFTQADASTTRTFGGTGLGLSISQRLVELMGGEITVESAPSQGSTFRFTAEFGICAGPTTETPVSDAMRALKVLVVDDRESARFLISEYLRILGVAHMSVDSAAAAIVALKEADATPNAAYSLALVDWRMPDMDGLQLVDAIAAYPSLQSPPLVALISAFGREEVQQQAMSAGCVDFLAKPISLAQLRELLERIATDGADAIFPDKSTRHQKEDDNMRFTGGLLLLAEDNPLNQQVAVGFLEAAGFQVMVAKNGVEAVRMAEERRFDGVLMDIQMPEMDGYVAASNIRQLPGYEKTPIIAMTAYASTEAVDKMHAVGMDEHIAKPIDLRRLFSVLARWFTVTTDKPQTRAGAAKAASSSGQRPALAPAAEIQSQDEIADRLESLIVVLRGSRPKACAQAFAALDIGQWPERPRSEIEKIRHEVDKYNFTQAINLAETLLRELKGESNA